MIALGIDIGTTHTKVLALDIEHGHTLAIEAVPTPVRRDADGDVRGPADVLDTVVELRPMSSTPSSSYCLASSSDSTTPRRSSR